MLRDLLGGACLLIAIACTAAAPLFETAACCTNTQRTDRKVIARLMMMAAYASPVRAPFVGTKKRALAEGLESRLMLSMLVKERLRCCYEIYIKRMLQCWLQANGAVHTVLHSLPVQHSAGGTVPIEEQALLLHIDSHTAISLMLEKDQLCLCCFSLCTWSCLKGTAKR